MAVYGCALWAYSDRVACLVDSVRTSRWPFEADADLGFPFQSLVF